MTCAYYDGYNNIYRERRIIECVLYTNALRQNDTANDAIVQNRVTYALSGKTTPNRKNMLCLAEKLVTDGRAKGVYVGNGGVGSEHIVRTIYLT